MNWQHVYRLAWKDWRRLRNLWIGLLAASLSCLLWWSYLIVTNDPGLGQVSLTWLTVAVFAPAILFAVAVGGAIYAGEHEEDTYRILAALPMRSADIFWGKLLATLPVALALALLIGVGAVSVLALTAQNAGTSFSEQVTRIIYDDLFPRSNFSLVGDLVAVAFLAAASGSFWSQRIRNHLVAIAAGTLTSIVLVLSGSVLIHDRVSGSEIEYLTWQFSALMVSLGFILLAFVYRGAAWWYPVHREANLSNVAWGRVHDRPRRPSWWRQVRTLMWSNSWFVWQIATVIGLCGIIAPRSVITIDSFRLCLCWLSALMLGVATFRNEQTGRRTELLAQLGVSRSRYWLSRMALPAGSLCLICLGARATFLMNLESVSHHYFYSSIWILFAWGQLCSLWLRSIVICYGTAFLFSLLTLVWLGVNVSLEEAAQLCAIPIVGALLLASYEFLFGWFHRSKRWPQYHRSLLVVGIMLVGVPLLWGMYRVTTYPTLRFREEFLALEPSVAVLEDADVREGVRLVPYDAWDSVQSTDVPYLESWFDFGKERESDLVKWIEGHSEEIHSYADQISRVEGDLMTIESGQDRATYQRQITLLMYYVSELMRQGDEASLRSASSFLIAALRLAESLANSGMEYSEYRAHQMERFVNQGAIGWAMCERSDADIVLELANQLVSRYERLQADFETTSQCVLSRQWYQYQTGLGVLAQSGVVRSVHDSGGDHPVVHLLAPWERVRRSRFLAYTFANQNPSVVVPEDRHKLAGSSQSAGHEVNRSMHTSFHLEVNYDRVALIYQLAAIAYHKERGMYPATTQEVESFATINLPADPYQEGRAKLVYHLQDHGLAGAEDRWVVRSPSSPLPVGLSYIVQEKPLPSCDDWQPREFAKQSGLVFQPLGKPPAIASAAEEEPAGYGGSMGGYGMSGEFGGSFGGEYGLPPAMSQAQQERWGTTNASLIEVFEQLEWQAEEMVAATKAAQDFFSVEAEPAQIRILAQLTRVEQASVVRQLLPILRELSATGSPAVAEAARTVLRAHAISPDELPVGEQTETPIDPLTPPDAADESATGDQSES